jgi:hypothetical protein
MNALTTFLAGCRKSPDASCKAADLIRAFRATLTPEEAGHWPRSRVLIEVGKQFPIGRRVGVMYVGGVSLKEESWQVSPTGDLVLA